MEYIELMGILSVPRPNGSPAEQRTRQALLDWLESHHIPHHLHNFRLYPNFFTAIGLWLIVSRTVLAVAVWSRWGWPALPIAIAGLLGGLVDVALGFPLVSWPGAIQGTNIIVEFKPANALQEIILSAHYDTKTELLDHHQRMFFIKNLRFGILLTLVLGFLGPIDRALLDGGSSWAVVTLILGIALSLPLLFLAWGLGINLTMGHFRAQSQGAVDNGAACAILLGLADRVQSGALALEQTQLTLALFTGEEVNMQGSRAYTRERQWSMPALAVNLEVLAQDGDYVFWEQDGTALKLTPTSAALNQALSRTVKEVTGFPAKPAGPVNSDGYSFIRVGVPSTTLGTYDTRLVDRGFHGPNDNLDRVMMDRLPEAVEILAQLLHKYDQETIPFPDL